MKPSTRPLLWSALVFGLLVGAVALARQAPPSVPPPSLLPGEPRIALEAVTTTADSFLQHTQQVAERRLAELTEQCDRLRMELRSAEDERAKWEAISEAVAEVPDRLRSPGNPISSRPGRPDEKLELEPLPEPSGD
jgi:hypothetical protein